jgi:hypothetical protein
MTVGGTTEAKEMMLLRDLVVGELQKRGFDVLSVPDPLSMSSTIQWINARGRRGDVALEICANAYQNPDLQGAAVFYIANNLQRQKDAELLLNALLDSLAQLHSRGTKPDTIEGVRFFPFCRDIFLPSLVMEVGFLTNDLDRFLLQNRRGDFAVGIAEGLDTWSRNVSGTGPAPGRGYSQIGIKLNHQETYRQKGILASGNAYVPKTLVVELGVDLNKAPQLPHLQYQNLVYVRAVDLQDYSISVRWDNASHSVVLIQLNQIMGKGLTSKEQLSEFVQANTKKKEVADQFNNLPELYVEEASNEGINHDIAFSQMCLETNFLAFGDELQYTQNNFCRIRKVGSSESDTFPSARIGVRAHIQQLKAYAAGWEQIVRQPPVSEVVRYVPSGGSARFVEQVCTRWSHNPLYGNNILNLVRRLYKSASLL